MQIAVRFKILLMKDIKYTLGIVFACFVLATLLGYMAHETQSLVHLFSDVGNIVAICFYTFILSFLIWIGHLGAQLVRRLMA